MDAGEYGRHGGWTEIETNNVSKSDHGGTPVESHVYRDRVRMCFGFVPYARGNYVV